MKTIITAILIIVAVAAVLFILPFAIMFFSYVFGIDMDENGGLHECIGCPYRTYGAVGVTDEAGKTIEVVEGSRIPEQWVERRPPRRFLQLNSAPLCVPHEVDSWYVATVC